MVNKRSASLLSLILLFLLTGCWDRKELNDRLFDLGGGIDQQKDGTYLLSAQFIIPSKSGESGKSSDGLSYFIATSTGKSVFDGLNNMQKKLSRTITRGHRRNLFIGESLAKEGINSILDSFSRDPESRIRTDLWVVKNKQAIDVLKLSYPLEKIPALAALKIHQASGGEVGSSFLDYLLAADGEESSPTLPVVDIVRNPLTGKDEISFYGRAAFNRDNQLVGYMDYNEAHNRAWIIGTVNNIRITTQIPNQEGLVSAEITHPLMNIHTTIDTHKKVSIDVELGGQGIVRENETVLDLSESTNLQTFENAINLDIEKQVHSLIQKAQKQLNADVFGFGETISRQHPNEWKSLKARWFQAFPEAAISVHAHVVMREIGLHGPPLSPIK
jgi:spore germination protein KC